MDWATGRDPAPVWLDVAREYRERFVHQQQIREATGRPRLSPELTAPVLTAAAAARLRGGHHRGRGDQALRSRPFRTAAALSQVTAILG